MMILALCGDRKRAYVGSGRFPREGEPVRHVVTAARLDGVADREGSERGPEHHLSRRRGSRRERSRQEGQEPRKSREVVMKRFGYTVGFVGFLLLLVALPLHGQQAEVTRNVNLRPAPSTDNPPIRLLI